MRQILLVALLMACQLLKAECRKFWLGADVSWTTEFEAEGRRFYDYAGNEKETFALMKDMGLDAVRLRVWVDPAEHGGWCNREDVLAKALRAKNLGMEVMVDFHYSDWWADPSKQNIPKAWETHAYSKMLGDVKDHTIDVLRLLKDNGVEPLWVQVGNETSGGMLWPLGSIDKNPQQYAGFVAAGYDAVKSVFPKAKVIVHLDNGFDDDLYNYNLDILRQGGARWDVIGMSIYPYWAKEWGKENSAMHLFRNMRRNIKQLVKRYGTDVMVVETGFEVDGDNAWKMEVGRERLAELIRICRDETEGHCLGVFYWEPTAKPSHYKLGAFTEDGHPTAIMRAFTQSSPGFMHGLPYDRPVLRMQTTEGEIVYELYNETPLHRDNMLRLVDRCEYDSMLFHRVIRNFMVQCGDPESKEAVRTTKEFPAPLLGDSDVCDEHGKHYTLPAEVLYPRYFHKRGAVAAAREGDDVNPRHESSASQFYFVWGDRPQQKGKATLPYYFEEGEAGTPWLDGGYTVFGEILSGLDVVKRIQDHAVDENDRPVNDVRILKIERLNDKR